MGITWSQIITPLLVAALTGVVGGFCRYVSKRLNEMKVSNAALKDGQRDSLRYQIVQAEMASSTVLWPTSGSCLSNEGRT